MKNLVIVICMSFAFFACEDVVEIDSGFTTPQIVVDGWITNDAAEQTITLTRSQDYFDSSPYQSIDDAQVVINNGTEERVFEFSGDGNYTWTPTTATPTIGTIGDTWNLTIQIGEKTLTSSAPIKRVPPIDSISIYFEENAFGADEGLYAQLYASDFPGVGDTYLVRGYRNDTLLNRPEELTIMYDATFAPGSENNDGFTFIFPLRFNGVNMIDTAGLPIPLNIGDEVRAELHSISNEAFNFLTIVQEQTTNGNNGIFALPIANSSGNIKSSEADETVLGMFNIASVSRAEVVVE